MNLCCANAVCLGQTPEPDLYLGEMSNAFEDLSARNRLSFFALGGFAVAGGVVMVLAFAVDAAFVAWVRADSTGWSRWLAGRVSYWGDWYGVLAVGLVLWWRARRQARKDLQKLLLLMGACAAISGLGANVIRATTGRARPFAQAAPGWYGPSQGLRFAKNARDYQAFPSAHTAVVAGFCAPLGLVARRRRRYAIFAVALAGTALMMWARVWVGAHHVSDVCAAALLGWTFGWFTLRRGGVDSRNL